jgi:hypothetical protein
VAGRCYKHVRINFYFSQFQSVYQVNRSIPGVVGQNEISMAAVNQSFNEISRPWNGFFAVYQHAIHIDQVTFLGSHSLPCLLNEY